MRQIPPVLTTILCRKRRAFNLVPRRGTPAALEALEHNRVADLLTCGMSPEVGRGHVMDDNNKPTGPKGPMAVSMQGSPPHKRKSSLNRETQIKIGTQLQIGYNEVVNQGVPDRF